MNFIPHFLKESDFYQRPLFFLSLAEGHGATSEIASCIFQATIDFFLFNESQNKI
jgi:hypothetical protein